MSGKAKKKPKRNTLIRRLFAWAPTRALIELQLRLTVFALTALGPAWAYFWGRRMAGLGWLLMPRLRNVALRNLDLCLPELPRARRTEIARASFKHSVYTFLDVLMAPRLLAGERWREVIRFEGDCESYFKWEGEPRASFNLSAHLGNWEFLLLVTGRMARGFSVVMRDANLPLVTRWLVRYRSFARCETIDKDGALKALLHRARQGQPVALLADQNGGDHAVEFPLFGVMARWQAEFTRLLPRTGGRVALGWVLRDGDRFRFVFHAPVMRTFADDTDPMKILAWYRDWIEERLRQVPEQYMWVHRRFKGRPQGAPDRYRDLGRRLEKDEIEAFLAGR